MEKYSIKEQIEQPPLGIMPKDIYYKIVALERLKGLKEAIANYYNANLPIDIEWVKEYNELIAKTKNK